MNTYWEAMSIQQLVRGFAPVLHFHPKEGEHCCFPSDAEEVLKRYHMDWTLFGEGKAPKTLDRSAPRYFGSWTDDNLTQIRYWIWYNYNDFPTGPLGIGKHLGDWEHIEVRLFQGLDPVCLLSNHDSARIAASSGTFPGFATEAAMLEDTHLHAWVALGSHAHYPSPTSQPRCYARLFCDKIADNGATWHTEQNLKSLADTNFNAFKGRWGDQRSPWSPLNEHNNRWRNTPDLRPV